MSKNKIEECNPGVCCHVENCVYHTMSDMCSADSIDVKNESAMTKAETFCGTFAPQSQWQ